MPVMLISAHRVARKQIAMLKLTRVAHSHGDMQLGNLNL